MERLVIEILLIILAFSCMGESIYLLETSYSTLGAFLTGALFTAGFFLALFVTLSLQVKRTKNQ